MNYTAYHVVRHFTCIAVSFVPRRIATAALDHMLATFLPDLDRPITVPDFNGEDFTL